MNELEKAKEILVECGYPMTKIYYDSCAELQQHKEYDSPVHIDPFVDTLEGRRQLDSIMDWIHENHLELLINGLDIYCNDGCYVERKLVCKYCLEELTK